MGVEIDVGAWFGERVLAAFGGAPAPGCGDPAADRGTAASAIRGVAPAVSASGPACAEAVPQVLLRADHQGRLVILMQRAQAQQVRAVPLQLDALRFHQSCYGRTAAVVNVMVKRRGI